MRRLRLIPVPAAWFCAASASPKNTEWVPTSGLGHGVQLRDPAPAGTRRRSSSDLPYVVAIVELDEGPLMLTNIVGCPVAHVDVGMRVAVTFLDASDDITLYPFHPDPDGG